MSDTSKIPSTSESKDCWTHPLLVMSKSKYCMKPAGPLCVCVPLRTTFFPVYIPAYFGLALSRSETCNSKLLLTTAFTCVNLFIETIENFAFEALKKGKSTGNIELRELWIAIANLCFDDLINHSTIDVDEDDFSRSVVDDESPRILSHVDTGWNLFWVCVTHLRSRLTNNSI